MVANLQIPGYELTEVIHDGFNTIVYRGQTVADQQPVILKILKAEYPSIDAIARLKHEYQITAHLDLNCIVKYQLQEYQNRLALVCPDFGGQSLKQILSTQKIDHSFCLSIGIQLAQALSLLHKQQIIHKDIKPANIIINLHSQQIKLTDFSIASCWNETLQPTNPNQLEGTLAYMSPEQTGRMNRYVDYRSDFYSFGVTLYEIFTGQLPFTSNDPLELIYCHLAQQPVPLSQINSTIPPEINQIVGKLMAKNAEDRYQSAAGLLVDLQICLHQLQTSNKINNFTAGRLDILSQLLIPQKLYGREQQINILQLAMQRVGEGSSELMLVSGYSGIGKTSVINEVNKPITKQRGYFISGKFDQFQRNIPYVALIQALSALTRQILTENAAQLQAWKSKILKALGLNGQVMIDLIPDLELIIDLQPEVAQLGSIESQNRFNRVFSEFIRVFAQAEHPLAIFLDDLQWADLATLKLMQLLITDPETKHLLLIGAYRDHEVNFTHPLIQILESIQQAGITINNIVLQPLSLENVTQLITETLTNTNNFSDLAELIYHKTAGNPFFVTQLLQALYQENLLKFQYPQPPENLGSWQWDLQEMQAIGITDQSVVELVASRISKLPEATQEIIKLAACLGNTFTLDVLSIVNKSSSVIAANALYAAVQMGLILPLSEAYKIPLLFAEENPRVEFSQVNYKFLHDRVQQAAYSLIPADEKKTTHLNIGQLIWQNTPTEKIETYIFDIVNQLNFGIDTLILPAQKNEVVRLNLTAGRKAKVATAYSLSLKYLTICLELLSIDAWQNEYDLTLAIHVEAAEAAYLTGEFAQLQQLTEMGLQQAKDIFHKLKIYEVQILTCIAQKKYQSAIEIGLSVLKIFGFNFPKKPTKINIILSLLRTKIILIGKRIEDLINLPMMTESKILAVMKILNVISAACYLSCPELNLVITLSRVNLSIKYGNAPISALTYAGYGFILCAVVNNIELGYKFGNLALDLLARSKNKAINVKVLLNVGLLVYPWKRHLKESIALFQLGVKSGLESGNLDYTGWCYFEECLYSYMIGQELTSLERKIATIGYAIRQISQALPLNHNQMVWQVVLNLTGASIEPDHLMGEAYNEEENISQYIVAKDITSLCALYWCKLQLSYLFGKYSQALEYSQQAAKYLVGITGSPIVPLFYFYDSLTRLAIYSQQQQVLKIVQASQKKMQYWAKHSPLNYLHKFNLVQAELYRVSGKTHQAMDYYDRAIQGAAENGYIQEEALANERAAEFYLHLGKQKIAKTYMIEAYYTYIRWGAIAKAKELESRYPYLVTSTFEKISNDVTISMTSTSTQRNISLDMSTVLKASQALSGEIVFSRLLEKLIQLVKENAGAEKVVYIAKIGDELLVENRISSKNYANVFEPLANDKLDVPISLINYVERTRNYLIIDHAIEDERCKSEPFVVANKTLSILILPMIHQGELTGILYLENNLTKGAFTKDRLEVLSIIAAQAAISLENSRFYTTLETRVEERTAELQATLQELRQTQLKLIQSEKMSSLGKLVAGLAHEINNPISFIYGNLEYTDKYTKNILYLLKLYQKYYPNPNSEIANKSQEIDLDFLEIDLPEILSSMYIGASRIRDIILALRNFARLDESTSKAVNIHQGIDSTLTILQTTLVGIEVIKEYGKLPLVNCYAGEMNQVFANLIYNAVDAIQEKQQQPASGKIWIRTEAQDNQVLIQIADNGIGMSAEILAKIFDPFFTTKPVGKGTGLGLAISYQIVTLQHHGQLTCTSTQNVGSEFIIALPYV